MTTHMTTWQPHSSRGASQRRRRLRRGVGGSERRRHGRAARSRGRRRRRRRRTAGRGERGRARGEALDAVGVPDGRDQHGEGEHECQAPEAGRGAGAHHHGRGAAGGRRSRHGEVHVEHRHGHDAVRDVVRDVVDTGLVGAADAVAGDEADALVREPGGEAGEDDLPPAVRRRGERAGEHARHRHAHGKVGEVDVVVGGAPPAPGGDDAGRLVGGRRQHHDGERVGEPGRAEGHGVTTAGAPTDGAPATARVGQ